MWYTTCNCIVCSLISTGFLSPHLNKMTIWTELCGCWKSQCDSWKYFFCVRRGITQIQIYFVFASFNIQSESYHFNRQHYTKCTYFLTHWFNNIDNGFLFFLIFNLKQNNPKKIANLIVMYFIINAYLCSFTFQFQSYSSFIMNWNKI